MGTKIKKGDKPCFSLMAMCRKADWVEENHTAPWIVYDTETTGINVKQSRIVQISATKLERINGKYQVTGQLTQYIKPPFPMPEEASAVNNITDEMLKDKPTEEEAFETIKEFFGDLSTTAVSGYNNIHYDDQLMDLMWQRQSGERFQPKYVVDFMKMAQELVYKSLLASGRHRLGDVAELYGIKEDGMHNADTDVSVTLKLAYAMISDYRENFKGDLASQEQKICPRAISGMYKFQMSKIVNYVYFYVTADIDGRRVSSRFYYDIWNMRFFEDGNKELGFISDRLNLPMVAYMAHRQAGGDIAKFKDPKDKKKEVTA